MHIVCRKPDFGGTLLISFFKFLKGYVRIRLVGGSPERFLNLCSKNEIIIWQIVRHGDNYDMYLSVPAFRQLKTIIKKTNVKVKIIEKHGLPFFFYQYRKRKMFFAGIFICGFFVYFLSLFVWQIEFNGNFARTDEILLEILEENQVAHGMKKSKVDCEGIEKLLRAECSDIIWTSAKLVGTRLIIDIQENTDTSVVHIDQETASDLLADKEAIITSIITRAGTPYVKAGDVVNKGDMLVGGALPITDDAEQIIDYQYVAADADIYGKTIYEYKDSFPLKYEVYEPTGNTQKSLYVKLHEKSFFLGKNRISYKTYHILSDIKQLRMGENFYLPVSIGSINVIEEEKITKQYTKSQAENKAKENLVKFMKTLQEKGVQIQKNNVTIEVGQNECHATGNLTVIEKLGIRQQTSIIDLNTDGKELEVDGETGTDH